MSDALNTPAPVTATRMGWQTTIVAAICLGAVLAAGWDIGNEARTTAGGDTPRYLMNGEYFCDLLHDRPFGSVGTFLDYTRYYYARYPALSLGHHPVLLSLMEVPLFWAAGPSVAAGRALVAGWFAVLVLLTFALGRDLFDGTVGVAAALLVTVNMYLLDLGRTVIAEVPGLALLVLAAWLLYRFCEHQRRRDLVLFTAAATLAIYTKQLTVFAFPGLLAYALARLGVRRLFARDIVVAALVGLVAVAPMAFVTLDLSRSNVSFVMGQQTASRQGVGAWAIWAARLDGVRAALSYQFAALTLLLAAGGLVLAVRHRSRAGLFVSLWFVSVLVAVLFITGILEPIRYSVYWMPAIAILAASPLCYAHTSGRLALVALALAVSLGQQGITAYRAPMTITTGYEEVARFVIAQPPAPTLLFSGEIDSGLFVFFVRKHDPARRQIVLRADKVLTTSFMLTASVEDRVSSPEQIYDVLNRLGVGYIVMEDRVTSAKVLEWVRQMVRTARFQELYRVPVVSTDPRMRHAALAVYRYVDARPPAPDANLDMHLPLVGRSIDLQLSDLLERKYLR